MLDFDIKNKCCCCEACYNICPTSAISINSGYDGFYYPDINMDKCVNCGSCDRVCPVIKDIENNNYTKRCFMAFSKEEDIRKESSSGGVFTELAEEILKKNGVVFGAAFNKDLKVTHTSIDNIEDMYKIRGSKYSQSKMNDSYKEVKEYLKDGRKVLFSGTPCQIAGLYYFFNKSIPNNLYLCDIVCHGTPSPIVFDMHIKKLQKDSKKKIVGYKFRNKNNGWHNYNTQITYDNGSNDYIIFRENIYMRGFLKDLYLKSSCYNCKFKGNNILSDITLGDFWGIENIYPEIDDDKGISAVIANTEKGYNLIVNIESKIYLKETTYDNILVGNSALVKSVAYNKKREKFFSQINTLDIHKNIRINTKDSRVRRLRSIKERNS